jgi:glycosyltransferase involved in cell wall biosynthesis
MKGSKKVLVVATSKKGRGGITSVIREYESSTLWKAYGCRWLVTHIDKSFLWKIFYFLKSFLISLFVVPFYSIIHIHFSEPPSAFRKLFFVLIAKIFGKKIILHFHSFSVDTTIQGRFGKFYGILFKMVDVVLVLSPYWKSKIKDKYPTLRNIKVLYNPCDTHEINVTEKKHKHILFAGTLTKRKGYMDMIQAFSKVGAKAKDWKLVFAGNGDIKEAIELSKKYGVPEQCDFLGWIDGSRKDSVFKASSIFCLPSYAEGFPMAVLDAWSFGLPCVVTPVGGLPDIVINKKHALVVEPGNINQLADALGEMIADETLRKKISRESLRLSKELFDIKVIAKQLSEIYNNI